MSSIIGAEAAISAEDHAGNAFSIARKFKEVGKGAKAAPDMGKLDKEPADRTSR